jgi:hypothetical protein
VEGMREIYQELSIVPFTVMLHVTPPTAGWHYSPHSHLHPSLPNRVQLQPPAHDDTMLEALAPRGVSWRLRGTSGTSPTQVTSHGWAVVFPWLGSVLPLRARSLSLQARHPPPPPESHDVEYMSALEVLKYAL